MDVEELFPNRTWHKTSLNSVFLGAPGPEREIENAAGKASWGVWELRQWQTPPRHMRMPRVVSTSLGEVSKLIIVGVATKFVLPFPPIR